MNHFIAENISGEKGWLNADETHHAQRVLRLKPKVQISVTQGDGKIYRAILEPGLKKVQPFKIEALVREENQAKLHLAVAPTKSNDRFEFFLEKATELGVASITPIICQNSERKVYKQVRGQRIIMAAVKQSKKGWIPTLQQQKTFPQFLETVQGANAYLAHLNSGPRANLKTINLKKEHWILIGPEGDFSPSEIKMAQEKKLGFLDLGEEVLRTETAAISVAAAAAYQRL